MDPVVLEEAVKTLQPKKLFYPASFQLAADTRLDIWMTQNIIYQSCASVFGIFCRYQLTLSEMSPVNNYQSLNDMSKL